MLLTKKERKHYKVVHALLPQLLFGIWYRPEMPEWIYINKLNEVDQIKKNAEWIHTVCSGIKAKANLKNTFFHIVPTGSTFLCNIIYVYYITHIFFSYRV